MRLSNEIPKKSRIKCVTTDTALSSEADGLSYSVYPAAELRRQLLSTKFQIPNSDSLGF